MVSTAVNGIFQEDEIQEKEMRELFLETKKDIDELINEVDLLLAHIDELLSSEEYQ